MLGERAGGRNESSLSTPLAGRWKPGPRSGVSGLGLAGGAGNLPAPPPAPLPPMPRFAVLMPGGTKRCRSPGAGGVPGPAAPDPGRGPPAEPRPLRPGGAGVRPDGDSGMGA